MPEGNVIITGEYSSQVEYQTQGGNIRAENDGDGDLAIQTYNGNVTVECSKEHEKVRAQTYSGNVTMYWWGNNSADVQTHSGNVHVTGENRCVVDIRTHSGNATVRANDGMITADLHDCSLDVQVSVNRKRGMNDLDGKSDECIQYGYEGRIDVNVNRQAGSVIIRIDADANGAKIEVLVGTKMFRENITSGDISIYLTDEALLFNEQIFEML